MADKVIKLKKYFPYLGKVTIMVEAWSVGLFAISGRCHGTKLENRLHERKWI